MKMRNKKGFTLTELLIVMAIIAVLAAFAVPQLGKQIESARESNDLQTLRVLYDNALADYMSKGGDQTATFTPTQRQAGWQYADLKNNFPAEVSTKNGGNGLANLSNTAGYSYTLKFTFEEKNNEITATVSSGPAERIVDDEDDG